MSAILSRRNPLMLAGGSTGQLFKVVIVVPASSVTEDLTGFHTSIRVQLDPAHATDSDPYCTDENLNLLGTDVISWDSTTGRFDAVVRLDLSASVDTTVILFYGS